MNGRRRHASGALAVAVAVLLVPAEIRAAVLRVVSLDQCADQYVLALAPRAAIAGVSRRARQPDSALRDRAIGLTEARPDLETVLALHPTMVMRTWGGDAALLGGLGRRGVRVVTLADPSDFAGIRADVRQAAAALDRRGAGEAIIRRMDRRLSEAANAGRGRSALYLSAGGETAGPDTLMGALLWAAGYRDVERRLGYHAVSLEHLVFEPPARVVAGFFDADLSLQRWSLARQGALTRLLFSRAIVRIPAAELACPSWTIADAVARLAAAARSS